MALKPIPYVRSVFASTAAPDPFNMVATNGPDTIPITTWDADEVRKAITPDRIGDLARHLGVKLTGQVRGKFAECYAVGREDAVPSATINRETGAYTDKGGDGKTLTVFDLAVKAGAYRSFPEAVNGLGKFLDAPPKSGMQGNTGRVRETQGDSAARKADPSAPNGFKSQGWKTLEQAIRAKTPAGTTPGERWMYPGEGFAVARYNLDGGGKTVRPFHVHPVSKLWTMGDPEGPLPLYRGDQLGSGAVLVTEGERCADLAAGLGFAAVTSSHGANSAKKTDWSALNGRDVVILPDANEAGGKYRDDVVGILRGLDPARRVRVLELPGLEPGSGDDIAEWIEAQPDQWSEDQVRAELRRLVDGAPDAAVAPPPADPDEPTEEELGLTTIADVADQELSWLWDDRILDGALTILAGEGEAGKTFAILDIIARLTTGRPFPDQVEAKVPPSDAIFITAEDRIAMVVKKRLREAGADLARVHTVGMGRDKKGNPVPFTIEDIARLEWILRKKPQTRMIVIDPVASFLGRADENKNAELRRVLGPLSDFADRTNVAIVCIAHFGKGTTSKPTHRIIGSVAWLNFVRSAWAVYIDPEDDEKRLFVRLKNNLSELRTGLSYRIQKQESGQGRVFWDLEPEMRSAEEIQALSNADKPAKRTQRKEAHKADIIAAMRLMLLPGPMSGDDVKAKLSKDGVCGKNKVWELKEEAGVIVDPPATFRGKWYWRINPDDTRFDRETQKPVEAP